MFAKLASVLALAGLAQAHFRLNYPLPRGNFVADDEPKFCGGYTDVTQNRTTFPLSGGFFKIRQRHANWTMGVVISTAANPNSFDAFGTGDNQQIVKPFTKVEEIGEFCFPLDLAAANITGVRNGANVTIQVMLDEGDGNLHQCADLILDSRLTAPPSTAGECKNETSIAPPADDHSGHNHGPGDHDHDHDHDDDGHDHPTPSGAAVAGVNVQSSALVAFLLGLMGVAAAF